MAPNGQPLQSPAEAPKGQPWVVQAVAAKDQPFHLSEQYQELAQEQEQEQEQVQAVAPNGQPWMLVLTLQLRPVAAPNGHPQQKTSAAPKRQLRQPSAAVAHYIRPFQHAAHWGNQA